MSEITKYKMSKRDFQLKLFELVNKKPYEFDKVIEDYENPSWIYLYYFDGKHFATWHERDCWTFDEVVKQIQ
jgi:hypothetical protein